MKTKRQTQQQVIQIKINFIKARVGCEKFTQTDKYVLQQNHPTILGSIFGPILILHIARITDLPITRLRYRYPVLISKSHQQ